MELQSQQNDDASLQRLEGPMRARLAKLYVDHRQRIENARQGCLDDLQDASPCELNGPYLVDPHDAYREATTKVVFVGQETCGWPSRDFDSQMETYRRFNLGEEYRSTPYWNAIRNLEAALTGKELSSVALNLNRFDVNRTRPRISARRILAELDSLLREELKLLAPDVVVFFTGPLHGYDDRLKSALNVEQEAIDGFPARQLCRLRSDSLPPASFRTYHPKSLRRQRLEARVLEAIVAEARSLLA